MLRGSSSASSELRRNPEFSAGSRDASHTPISTAAPMCLLRSRDSTAHSDDPCGPAALHESRSTPLTPREGRAPVPPSESSATIAAMSSDASAAVHAATAGINAAWRERRYDDLRQMFAEDMVFTLPGFSGLLQGREAIVASYREFIERVTLTSYREEQLVVTCGAKQRSQATAGIWPGQPAVFQTTRPARMCSRSGTTRTGPGLRSGER